MGSNDRAVEYLLELRGWALFRQRLEKGLETTASAEAREPFPHAVRFPYSGGRACPVML